MNEFDDLESKARACAEEHPEQAGQGINEAAQIAERDTDHQHDEQIERAVNAAEQHMGAIRTSRKTQASPRPRDR